MVLEVDVGPLFNLRVVETRPGFGSALRQRLPSLAQDASAQALVEPRIAVPLGKRIDRHNHPARDSRTHRDPDMIGLGGVLVPLQLPLKVTAHSVNKGRRERIGDHGSYASPAEGGRFAGLRRGWPFKLAGIFSQKADSLPHDASRWAA